MGEEVLAFLEVAVAHRLAASRFCEAVTMYVSGRSPSEISRELGIGLNTVKYMLRRARELLGSWRAVERLAPGLCSAAEAVAEPVVSRDPLGGWVCGMCGARIRRPVYHIRAAHSPTVKMLAMMALAVRTASSPRARGRRGGSA